MEVVGRDVRMTGLIKMLFPTGNMWYYVLFIPSWLILGWVLFTSPLLFNELFSTRYIYTDTFAAAITSTATIITWNPVGVQIITFALTAAAGWWGLFGIYIGVSAISDCVYESKVFLDVVFAYLDGVKRP
jgi:hypothetical protein